MIVVDTGGLIAALDPGQQHSPECAAVLNTSREIVTSPLVLAEVEFIVSTRFGTERAVKAMSEIGRSRLMLAHIDWVDIAAANEVVNQYADLGVGLTDASLVILAKRFNTNQILTLDQRHFRAMRGLDGKHFKLLPFDIDD